MNLKSLQPHIPSHCQFPLVEVIEELFTIYMIHYRASIKTHEILDEFVWLMIIQGNN